MSTLNIPFLNIKKNQPKLSQIYNYVICSKGPKNEFETAKVNKPSVFEPLKFYCSTCIFEHFNELHHRSMNLLKEFSNIMHCTIDY